MKIDDLIEILQTIKGNNKGCDYIWGITDFKPNGQFIVEICKGYKEFEQGTMTSNGGIKHIGVKIDCADNMMFGKSISELDEDEVDEWG